MGGVLCGRRRMLLTLRCEGSQRSPGRSKTLSHFGCVLAFFCGGDSICGMCIGSDTCLLRGRGNEFCDGWDYVCCLLSFQAPAFDAHASLYRSLQ